MLHAAAMHKKHKTAMIHADILIAFFINCSFLTIRSRCLLLRKLFFVFGLLLLIDRLIIRLTKSPRGVG